MRRASETASLSAQTTTTPEGAARNPWSWIPTLYLAEGLPYAVVMFVAAIMYKSLGLSNTEITFYTGWLYLPWVIKPLWSPVVDILKTRRVWIWTMQLIIGGGLAGIALTIPTAHFLRYTLAFLWLLAFSSATHDIAADGFYMLALSEKDQAFFVGIRSTFYRISLLSGQGLLVILAGWIQTSTGLPRVLLTIEADPGASALVAPRPGDFAIQNSFAGKGPLRAVVSSDRIHIRPERHPLNELKPILSFAKDWNLTNGFTAPMQNSAAADEKKVAPSLWDRAVSEPLGNWLRKQFGVSITKSDTAGSVGFAYLRLDQPPSRETVVHLSLKSGDKSISLVEGSRLIFNDQNWNKPAIAVFQLDPKLKERASAVFEIRSGNVPLSWCVTFTVLFLIFLFFGVYHKFMLPVPAADRPGDTSTVLSFLSEFFKTFGAFFRKERIGILLLFLLLYRFAEAQLVSMVKLFLLDGREAGGLGLTTGGVGFVYGTVGVIALTCGGLLGGMVASRHGLKRWLWPMVIIMHVPDAVFVYLAYAQPTDLTIINVAVAIEQFGYGFGFTAYMLYMIYIARGQHETAHYAICTGFMALGMMVPGMFSGWLQDLIGYQHFFLWVLLATIPGFLIAAFIPLDPEFGKKA